MTLNLYVMPITTTVVNGVNHRGPKYASIIGPFAWSMFDYGNEPWCLIGVLDIDGPTDTALTANGDVRGIPSNLDQAIGAGALSTARGALEAVNIPGNWLIATNTWREAVQFVGAACQFAQRFQGMVTGDVWFTGGITLASTFSSLPAGARSALQAAAESFNFDTSGITGSATLRQIITSAANQYLAAGYPLIIAGTGL